MAVVESEKKVMVAIDESGSSYHALMWVLENLRESISRSANPLIIFMAQPSATTANVFAAPLGSARMYCPILANSEFVNSVQEQNKVVSMGILEKAKSICASHGVNAETITQVGDPKQAICDAVEKFNINLLVLGDHEIGKVKSDLIDVIFLSISRAPYFLNVDLLRLFLKKPKIGALIGSVSNYCVHNARCPVLVVKKPE